MPDSPDFDQIARKHLDAIDEDLVDGRIDRLVTAFAEQLRLVWNARGAVDIAKVEAVLYMDASAPYVKTIDRALRSLDR